MNKKIVTLLFTILLSATLYFFSTGLNDNYLLVWFAPLPILLFALHYDWRTTAITAFAAYFLGSTNFLFPSSDFPTALLLNFISGISLDAFTFTMIILISRWVCLKLKNGWAMFAFPAFWTSFEFLQANQPASGTYSSLAYSQLHFLPFIQLASLTGIWGLTFLLCLIPSAIAVAYYLKKLKKRWISCLILPTALMAMTLIFGFSQLHKSSSELSIRVALIATPTTLDESHMTDIHQITRIINQYGEQISLLKNKKIDIVLLPEKLARITPATQSEAMRLMSQIAQKNHVMLIAGASFFSPEKNLNQAWIFSENGKLLGIYNKQHLLPPFESMFTPGTQLSFFEIKKQLAGVAICKDMDFANPSKQYGQAKTSILFVPALDFVTDNWAHARIAIMQGIANHFAVVRAAQWGLLSVSDSHGRILAKQVTLQQHPAVLIADIQPGSGSTVYSRTGNWLGWFSCMLSLLIVFFAICQKNSLSLRFS